jgi:hypothetical protein
VVFFGKYIALILPSFINVCHCSLNKLTDTFSHYRSTYIFLRISFKGTGNRKDPRYIQIRGINDGVISGERCIQFILLCLKFLKTQEYAFTPDLSEFYRVTILTDNYQLSLPISLFIVINTVPPSDQPCA